MVADRAIVALGHERILQTLERYVAALNEAGPGRTALAAELALRLARGGHLTDLKFHLADRLEAFEAFRSALEAHASSATQASRVSPETDARDCDDCGASFRVNPRHAAAHRYCLSACRAERGGRRLELRSQRMPQTARARAAPRVVRPQAQDQGAEKSSGE